MMQLKSFNTKINKFCSQKIRTEQNHNEMALKVHITQFASELCSYACLHQDISKSDLNTSFTLKKVHLVS